MMGHKQQPIRTSYRGKRRLLPLSVFVICGALLSACSAQQDDSAPASSPPRITQEEAVRQYSDCMEAKGWEMVNDFEEGSSSPASPIHESQSEIFKADTAACSETGNEYVFTNFSMDDRKLMYDKFLDSRDCLADLGIDVKPAPTFQKFNDIEGDWTPFIDVPKGQLREVEKTCPQPFF